MEPENKNPIQSAERIFLVLETLADCPPVGLVELSNRLKLHKSTVHRLLSSLIFMGYVKQDDETDKYMLTFKLVKLSSKILSRMDVLSIAHPFMEQLALKCQETVHFVQRDGTDMIYLDKVEPPIVRESSIRMASQVGLSRPMYCSGVGKSVLAELPNQTIEEIWKNSIIEKKTEHTIITLNDLFKELELVRQHGYALDREENEIGVTCIAACIFTYQQFPKYAFSISAPTSRMTAERIQELAADVLNAQKKLSAALGYD